MGHLGNKTYQHSFLIAKEETEGVFFISFFLLKNYISFQLHLKNNIQLHLRKKKTIFKSPKVILKIEIKTVMEFIFHFWSLP